MSKRASTSVKKNAGFDVCSGRYQFMEPPGGFAAGDSRHVSTEEDFCGRVMTHKIVKKGKSKMRRAVRRFTC